MNFVLFHVGSNLPNHFKYCVSKIWETNPNHNIHLITNINITIPNIKVININSLKIPNIGSYYINDPNPLWRTAMLRIFYLQSYMERDNTTDVIHFDNDILIYENVDVIGSELRKNNFLISSADPLNYAFGFSYIKNAESLYKVTKALYDLVIQGEHRLEQQIGSMPHEMRLLKYINNDMYIKVLPILPTDIMFKDFNYCFDPSSYGQRFGGAQPEIDKYIGAKIISNELILGFENRKPIGILNNNKFKIFNLHMHNKKLEDFM